MYWIVIFSIELAKIGNFSRLSLIILRVKAGNDLGMKKAEKGILSLPDVVSDFCP